VARNKIIDHYRQTSLLSLQQLEQAQQREDQVLTLEGQVEEQEQRVWLAQAIEQLPPGQRELLRLRYVQELRITQVVALLEKLEGTVRKMLSRTLQRLRKLYEQYERRANHA
jgi:RNA polymerase sigma factor (sigma-70 family)